MKVKIKTWEKMVEEFGLDFWGWINCEGIFTDLMEKDMPQDRIIDIHYEDEDICWNEWEITEDMIEEHLDLDEKEDYLENLEFENKNMSEFLQSLGFNDEQISDIALTGKCNQD